MYEDKFSLPGTREALEAAEQFRPARLLRIQKSNQNKAFSSSKYELKTVQLRTSSKGPETQHGQKDKFRHGNNR